MNFRAQSEAKNHFRQTNGKGSEEVAN